MWSFSPITVGCTGNGIGAIQLSTGQKNHVHKQLDEGKMEVPRSFRSTWLASVRTLFNKFPHVFEGGIVQWRKLQFPAAIHLPTVTA